jgi:hypothetical protein
VDIEDLARAASMGPEDLDSVGDLEWAEFLPDGVDDVIDGESELRYEMLLARNRWDLEYAGSKMIILMMASVIASRRVSMVMLTVIAVIISMIMVSIMHDGLPDDVDDDVDDDVIDYVIDYILDYAINYVIDG